MATNFVTSQLPERGPTAMLPLMSIENKNKEKNGENSGHLPYCQVTAYSSPSATQSLLRIPTFVVMYFQTGRLEITQENKLLTRASMERMKAPC